MARSVRPRSDEIVEALEALEARRLFATFIVNAVGDAGTGNGTASSRTLRQAINAANATTAADTINFSFAGTSATTLSIASDLPNIINPVTIDATSEGLGGQSGVVLAPSANSTANNGLLITASNVTVRRLTIVQFNGSGITIFSGSNNLIAGNFIGTNISGTTAFGNGFGVSIFSANNTIGGITSTDRNVISGNDADGVFIAGDNATENVVAGNFIGFSTAGADLGNGQHGVTIRASGNRVGAATAAQGGTAARNVISGNGQDGVHIEQATDVDDGNAYETSDADNNVVAGNYIGTNSSGETDIGNGQNGVQIINGEGNVIGSADPVGRNVISGNDGRGVTVTAISRTLGGTAFLGVSQNNAIIGNYIGVTASGAALGNGSGGVVFEEFQGTLASFVMNNRVGGTAAGEGNVIGSNASSGISVQLNASSTTIQGNLIGLDPTGTTSRANGVGGVIFNNAAGNLLGGPGASARNVIGGNVGDGVRIFTTTTSSGASDTNSVLNNYIGTNAAGTAAVPNTQYGVRVTGGNGNVIGNSRIDTGSAGNLISGNGIAGIGLGVDVPGFTERGSTANTSIQNNSIGINAAGTAVLANGNDGGIVVSGVTAVPTTGTIIGGAGTGINRRGNLIVGANRAGYGISTGGASSGITVLGNRIGTTPAGTAKLGQLFQGLYIASPTVTVGSTAAGGGNVIAGSFKEGVQIAHPANNVTLVGNGIGTDLTGTADLGNDLAGVYVNLVLSSDANITLGGTTAASANRIAHNGADGVVTNNFGRGVEVVGNRIFDNAGLAIDLKDDGVTLNDTGDGDTGPNDLQNYPLLTSASSTGSGVTVPTTINSAADTALRIDYYAITGTPDASGHGESDLYLGSATVTTNASGNASTTPTFSLAGAPDATRITATATRTSDGSTSEFSTNAVIADNTPPTIVSGVFDVESTPQRLTITFSENVGASLTPSDLVLVNRTPEPDTAVPTANIALSYNAATNQATFTFPGYPGGILPNGDYRFLINAGAVTDAAGNALASAYSDTFFVLAGDADRNRVVNFNDFLVVQTNFNQTGRLFTQGDFNYDGKTDFDDFLILQTNFNATV